MARQGTSTRRQAATGQPDPFTATQHQNRQGQANQAGAVDLARLFRRGGKAHRGPRINPEIDRLGNLQFAFTNKLHIPARGSTVIDHPAAVALLQRPILPEIITHAGPPPPVVTAEH
jgi:hypothetical protein